VIDGEHMIEARQFNRFIYFALTTLTTIGFGDFLPKSTDEKVLISAILFVGVILFSLVLN
jgi:hypothetical protein